jgi:organic hydroperoxide reductase OsmC/OhrA
MHVTASIRHRGTSQAVSVATGADARSLPIPAKAAGNGSSANGGELLMLALATCYCNDLYREAAKRGIALAAVEVEAEAEFDGVGLAARDIRYRARIASPVPAGEIDALLRATDAVAEIHNTVRAGVAVERRPWDDDAA